MAVIYGLVHIASGRTLVGCTKNKLQKRFREHRCLLRNGKHSEVILQKEWVLYGEQAFEMRILEDLPGERAASEKREAELRWMSMLESEGLLYNLKRVSFQPSTEAMLKGVENSRRVGRWRNGVPKNHGDKIRAGIRLGRILRQSNDIV